MRGWRGSLKGGDTHEDLNGRRAELGRRPHKHTWKGSGSNGADRYYDHDRFAVVSFEKNERMD